MKNKDLRGNQDESPDIGTVTILNDRQLDEFLMRYSDDEIDEIADLWQEYVGKRYKNVIVTGEENGETA